MMKLKIEFAKTSVWVPLGLLRRFRWFELIQQESIIKTLFMWLYNLTPTWFKTIILLHIFDPWLRKMCNVTVTDIPLNWYKQNTPSLVIFLRVDKFYVVRFFFCRVYNIIQNICFFLSFFDLLLYVYHNSWGNVRMVTYHSFPEQA